ncbi:FAD-dependent oxidoreductase [Sphingosinicella rhizophila]|uniref:FAD-dependent oxidoreductase n=1 Tax=Sphingosinicella rhizophila TaxID=3050082 RepID=A0ABU3Q871_9SPHN|nr:FAD-dependent oxidoreductase [Sphingosinicella sp. GR2756]MDT9599601.1 FAD-dependent oxidoreductase [Sphingosinicella sp. GR2756]
MNVGDERSTSFWMQEAEAIDAPPLTADARCDVVVVGAGIAGLSTAYELARFGRSVIVIDRGRIGSGMTLRTTAHLATALDDYYFELIRVRGKDEARLYHDSQVAAVNRIEAICRDEGIDAGFRRLDGYLFAAEDKHRADLEKEYEACRTIGIDVAWADRAPVPGIDTGRCLRFPDQGRFDPTRYLAGLVRAIRQRGGLLYADTVHVHDKEEGNEVEVETEAGARIRAGAAIFATNSPTNDKVAIHSKQMPNRTYAIAGRVAKGSVPDALVWDSCEAYHYARIQELSDTEDLLIVGGGDHRSGEENDMDARLAALEQWTRDHYPSFGGTDYRWSGQVLEPIDFMPFSGRNPGNRNIYIHTGDSGQGITNGVAGSLTIMPLIIGEDSRYAPLFDPSRKSANSAVSLGEFVRGQAGAVKNLAEYVGPGEIGSPDDLKPGEGGILRSGLSKLAVYKNENGSVITRSAVCTHLGCIIHWNGFEKCWDCPCHGSQFAVDGQVLNGPAVQPLAEAAD